MSKRERFLWGAVVLTWVALVGAGVFLLGRYKSAPGERGHAPLVWPVDASLPRSADRSTLVLLAHPHCPCTRASLTELDAIIQKSHDQLDALVLFLDPRDAPPEWRVSDLWEQAGRIPHVVRRWDEDGRLAALFDAKTSGDTALYGPGGDLVFQGGITSARGHVGDNLGESAVVALAIGKPPAVVDNPVYGCPLKERR